MRTLFAAVAACVVLSACQTTSTPPYSPSTTNVIAMQSALGPTNTRINLGDFTASSGVNSTPTCRVAGSLDVAQSGGIPTYVKDALQQELFMAQALAADATVTITGNIDRVSVSTFGTGSWVIGLTVRSTNGVSYSVEATHSFSSSFSAMRACQNATNAFGMAVRGVIAEAVAHPQFRALTGAQLPTS